MALRQPFEVRVEGLKPFLKRIARIEKRSKRRAILRQAMQAGATPLKRALRNEIKSAGAVRKGHTKKAVSHRAKVYTSGVAVILTGVRDRKLPDGENPGKYFHLINLGVVPHQMEGGTSGKVTHPVYVEDIGEYRQVVKRRSYRHPGHYGYLMREAAQKKAWPLAQTVIFQKMETVLERELARA